MPSSARLRTTSKSIAPYTTLFRSDPHHGKLAPLHGEPLPAVAPAARRRLQRLSRRHGSRGAEMRDWDSGGREAAARAVPGRCDLALDRKSTRLNSSNRCISYAVFCSITNYIEVYRSLHDALPI